MAFARRLRDWKNELAAHWRLILLSLLLLALSIVVTFLAGNYTNAVPGVAVPDMILDNLPTFDTGWLYAYGFSLIITLSYVYPLFFRVDKLHIFISQFSLVTVIRALFTMLTHFGAPQGAISPPGFPGIVSALSFRQDYFFSGHVAFPFLCFLLFKESRIRWFFLASSIVMGVVVLLGHLHYSIDVFAAFFITYASYRIGGLVFSRL